LRGFPERRKTLANADDDYDCVVVGYVVLVAKFSHFSSVVDGENFTETSGKFSLFIRFPALDLSKV